MDDSPWNGNGFNQILLIVRRKTRLFSSIIRVKAVKNHYQPYQKMLIRHVLPLTTGRKLINVGIVSTRIQRHHTHSDDISFAKSCHVWLLASHSFPDCRMKKVNSFAHLGSQNMILYLNLRCWAEFKASPLVIKSTVRHCSHLRLANSNFIAVV